MNSPSLSQSIMRVRQIPKSFNFYKLYRKFVLIVVLNCALVSGKIFMIPQTNKPMTNPLFRIFDCSSAMINLDLSFRVSHYYFLRNIVDD